MNERIGIVGTGRVAQALARALPTVDVDVIGLAGRTRARTTPAATAVRVPARTAAELCAEADLVILAVSDDAIGAVAGALASEIEDVPGAMAHCSGALGRDVLAPLASRGVHTAAWHPLQAFATTETALATGIAWGITADPALYPLLAGLSERLGGRPLRVREHDRAAYHAAAVIAANYGTTLIATAVAILDSLDMPPDAALAALIALVRSSLDGLERAGLPDGLTGPAVRGDVGTVQRHLATLDPDAAALYRAVGLATLGLVEQRGLPRGKTRALREALVCDSEAKW